MSTTLNVMKRETTISHSDEIKGKGLKIKVYLSSQSHAFIRQLDSLLPLSEHDANHNKLGRKAKNQYLNTKWDHQAENINPRHTARPTRAEYPSNRQEL